MYEFKEQDAFDFAKYIHARTREHKYSNTTVSGPCVYVLTAIPNLPGAISTPFQST